jgi:hypothetical protein
MRAQVLRGNFQPKNNPIVDQAGPDDLTTRFEAEALKRLGGSIAFVSKKKFTLGLDAMTSDAGHPSDMDGAADAGSGG